MPGGGDSDQLTSLVAIAKGDFINTLMQRAQGVRLTVRHCVPSAVALFQAYRTTLSKPSECAFLLDVGHDRIEMALAVDGELIFARTMPGGGRKFSGAIKKLFNLNDEKAEQYKRERARIPDKPPPAEDRQAATVFAALKRPADEVANSVGNSLRYCQTQAKVRGLKVDRVILSGAGSRLPGLAAYIEKKARCPVVPVNLGESLDLGRINPEAAKVFTSVPSEMTVALGLAVCDADEQALSLNLVPPSVMRRRRFFQKTIYGYAAAAVAVLLAVVLMFKSQNALEEATKGRISLEKKLAVRVGVEKKHQKRAREILVLQNRSDQIRRQTTFALSTVEFMRQLRGATPKGITLTDIKPLEPNEESFDARFRIRVSGRSSLGRETTDAFVQKLDGDSDHPHLVWAGDLLVLEAKKDDPENIFRFAFTALLHSGFDQPHAPEDDGR
jgi:hypothetical protein